MNFNLLEANGEPDVLDRIKPTIRRLPKGTNTREPGFKTFSDSFGR